MEKPWLWHQEMDLNRPHLQPVLQVLRGCGEQKALMALKQIYENRTCPKLYFCDEDKDDIAAYVKQHCPDELKLVMQTAEEITSRIFTFRFPWDMERSNQSVRFEEEIRWDHIPSGDPEWTYMLNRHRYWVALGQAYAITGDEKYAEVVCRQMESWIDYNPVPPAAGAQSHAWRSIDAGIRSENWVKTYSYIKNSPHFSPDLFLKMLKSLFEHAEFIAAHPCTGWKRISNWSVLENRGLHALSLFMNDWKKAEDWRQESTRRLRETALLQVQKDGMHWEQSPQYHSEVLHCYMDYLLLTRNNQLEPDSAIVQTVKNMLQANLYIAKPNHHQPMQGDSDDNDLRETLTTGAILFEDAELKFGGLPELSFDHLWMFGMEAVVLYGKLDSKEPEHTSRAFVHTGNFVMRSGWSEQDTYLYFHCGFLGGGHGHADMLHFELHAFGRDLLVDAGRYNYGDHTPLRRELKQCSAHNTTMVDGEDFTEYIDSWTNGRIAEPRDVFWQSEPGFDYVQGSHTGYQHLPDPVTPLRRILFIKPDLWLICDSFECTDVHTFEQHFHFRTGDIRIDSDRFIAVTEEKYGANIGIIPIHPERMSCEARDSVISPEYNLIEPNRAVTYRRKQSGFTSMLQVLYPLREHGGDLPKVEAVEVMTYTGMQVTDETAEAVRIVFDQQHPRAGEEHLVLVCHRKPGRHIESYVVDGTQVFGEVVWIARDGVKEIVNVIK